MCLYSVCLESVTLIFNHSYWHRHEQLKKIVNFHIIVLICIYLVQNVAEYFWLIPLKILSQGMSSIHHSWLKGGKKIEERMFFNVFKQLKHTSKISDVVSTKPMYIVKMQPFRSWLMFTSHGFTTLWKAFLSS